MTEEQIEALGPALADFLAQFLFCCGYTQTFAHLGVSCRGLLSNLDRKTAEPIALASAIPVRTLQEFLGDHDWDQDRVRDLRQRHVASTLPDLPDDGIGTIAIVDAAPDVVPADAGVRGRADRAVEGKKIRR